MLAVLFALKSFSTLTHGKHVKVMVDNTVTDSTINQMGTSHSPKLKKSTKDIWEWCIQQHIWLTLARIPGCENVEADRESRTFRRCTEWCLKETSYFHIWLCKTKCHPSVTKPRYKGGLSLTKKKTKHKRTRETTQQLPKSTSIYYNNYTK